jgi:hypothetical protein
MLGMHQSPASWFCRRAVRGPAARQRHQRPRRMLTVEALEGRALLSQFVVTNLNDNGDGSLRQAIIDPNNTSPSRSARRLRWVRTRSRLPQVRPHRSRARASIPCPSRSSTARSSWGR